MMTATAAIAHDPANATADILRRIASSLTKEKLPISEYVERAWPIIEPSRPLIKTWAIDCILEHLAVVDLGQITRLLINIPPRTLKSITASILWPTWCWTDRPWLRWIFCSYSSALSLKHSRDRRRIIESPWYQKEWGDMVALEEDQNQVQEYQNTQRGVMVATSVGGSITGKGGDRVVIDDLINPLDAESKAIRDSSIEFFKSTLLSRLDDKKTGSIVAIEQRTHKSDLSGNILKEGGWTVLKIPAEAPTQTVVKFPLSGREIVRQEGQVICEEREDKATLAQLKIAMGSRAYAAQYQQEPIAIDSGYFHTGWWKFYRSNALPDKIRSCRGWDTAVKTGQDNDYTAACLIHQCANGYYLDPHFYKARIKYPELRQRIVSENAARPVEMEPIEDASSGSSVIQDLQINTNIPIIPFSAVKDKVTRASIVSPLVEAGKVFLPEDAPWVADFIDNCASFPMVEHDDDIDAFMIALMQISGKTNSGVPNVTVI